MTGIDNRRAQSSRFRIVSFVDAIRRYGGQPRVRRGNSQRVGLGRLRDREIAQQPTDHGIDVRVPERLDAIILSE